MSETVTEPQAETKKKRTRKDKLAPHTGAEILEKAAREAKPTTPAERRRLEREGQMLMPGHIDLPRLTSIAFGR